MEENIQVKEDDFNFAVSDVLREHFKEIQEISVQQSQALFSFLCGRRDVFAILLTGFGKSLIFQRAPLVAERLAVRGYSFRKQSVVIIVCPLRSLIDSHVRELTKRGLKALGMKCRKRSSRIYFVFI